MKKHPNRPAKHPRALQERDLQAIRGGGGHDQQQEISNVLKTRHDTTMSIIQNFK